MRFRVLAPLLALTLVAPGLVPAQESDGDRPPAPAAPRPWAGPRLRGAIESLEARLDRAVSRVSAPQPGVLLGRADSSRGYRLPGYGVVFVLAPRALPGDNAVFFLRQPPNAPSPASSPATPPLPGDDRAWPPERVEEIEREVLILQHVAESERRAAEKDMDRIVHDVRVRLAAPPEAPSAPDAPAPPAADGETPPPAPPADELALPESPPWKFWFEVASPGERRSPDRVVADVRAAVVGVLESPSSRIVGLGPDESLTVAVDFVPGDVFAVPARPARTLVVRVRQRDLEARARGALGREELRGRVDVTEY
jgi:hypothetical protein